MNHGWMMQELETLCFGIAGNRFPRHKMDPSAWKAYVAVNRLYDLILMALM